MGSATGAMVGTGTVAAASGKTLAIARENASADWNRLAGSFATDIKIKSLIAAGRSGRSSIGGFGIVSRCARMIEKPVSPTNGRWPVMSS